MLKRLRWILNLTTKKSTFIVLNELPLNIKWWQTKKLSISQDVKNSRWIQMLELFHYYCHMPLMRRRICWSSQMSMTVHSRRVISKYDAIFYNDCEYVATSQYNDRYESKFLIWCMITFIRYSLMPQLTLFQNWYNIDEKIWNFIEYVQPHICTMHCLLITNTYDADSDVSYFIYCIIIFVWFIFFIIYCYFSVIWP